MTCKLCPQQIQLRTACVHVHWRDLLSFYATRFREHVGISIRTGQTLSILPHSSTRNRGHQEGHASISSCFSVMHKSELRSNNISESIIIKNFIVSTPRAHVSIRNCSNLLLKQANVKFCKWTRSILMELWRVDDELACKLASRIHDLEEFSEISTQKVFWERK